MALSLLDRELGADWPAELDEDLLLARVGHRARQIQRRRRAPLVAATAVLPLAALLLWEFGDVQDHDRTRVATDGGADEGARHGPATVERPGSRPEPGADPATASGPSPVGDPALPSPADRYIHLGPPTRTPGPGGTPLRVVDDDANEWHRDPQPEVDLVAAEMRATDTGIVATLEVRDVTHRTPTVTGAGKRSYSIILFTDGPPVSELSGNGRRIDLTADFGNDGSEEHRSSGDGEEIPLDVRIDEEASSIVFTLTFEELSRALGVPVGPGSHLFGITFGAEHHPEQHYMHDDRNSDGIDHETCHCGFEWTI